MSPVLGLSSGALLQEEGKNPEAFREMLLDVWRGRRYYNTAIGEMAYVQRKIGNDSQ